jgi:hypothetical protein
VEALPLATLALLGAYHAAFVLAGIGTLFT